MRTISTITGKTDVLYNNSLLVLYIKRCLLLFSFCLLFITTVNAQSNDDKTACWTGSNCTSGDFLISKIYLASDIQGTPLSTCSTPGAAVDVYLAIEFTNTTSSDRNGIFLSGNISSNNSSRYIFYCFNGLLPKKAVTRFVAPDKFTWICGQTITLVDGFTGWNSASGPVCVSNGCGGTTISKCRRYPSQVIQSPLVADFSFEKSCPNGATVQTVSFTNLTTGGTTPYTYKWEYTTANDENSWVQFSSVANPVWTPGTAATYRIRLTVTDKDGKIDNESKAGVVVAPCCTTPQITANPTGDTKCEGGSISFTAEASGTPSPTVQWQEKIGNGSFVDISNGTFNGITYAGATATTLTISGLKASQSGNQYRAVFTTSAACPSANSNAATLMVDPPTVGGSVAATTSPICTGSATTVTLSNHTGSVVKWQKSTNGIDWTDIVSTSTSISTGNLTTTTQFLAVVKSGTCAAVNSAPATVTVDPPTQAGAVSGGKTVCSGTNSGTLQLGGTVVGNVIRWESAPDNNGVAGVWTEIKNNGASITATSYDFSNLTATTWFRAVVQSGVCASANATPAKVTVDPMSVGGTAGSAQTVCSGSQPINNLSVSGITGNVIKWQKSTDNFVSSIVDISGTASSTLLVAKIGTLTEDTWFRAVVQSGVCDEAHSSSVKITVGGIPEKPAFTVAQPSLCGPAKGSITICQSISGYNYTVGSVTKPGTGGSLTFADLVAGSNPTLSVVNTTGNCPASTTYTCNDAEPECPEQLVGTSQRKMDHQLQTADLSKGTTIKAFPNPFNDRVKFVVTSETAGKASLEVFNMLGQKVKTVYTGHVAPGVQNFELSIPANQRSTLIYVWRMGENQITGKLFQSGN